MIVVVGVADEVARRAFEGATAFGPAIVICGQSDEVSSVAFVGQPMRSFHADVFRAGVWLCRIAFAGQFTDAAAAQAAATMRVSKWLEEFQSRRFCGLGAEAHSA